MSEWTEVRISVDVADIEKASGIATMAVPYGIYIEDYSDLEEQAWEIARIDLIDEELLKKDRSKAVIHIYVSPEDNPLEAIHFLRERLAAEKIESEIESGVSKSEDWENNWKKYFHTLPVGERLLIHPVWETDFDPKGRTVLDIEPGLAFGSGSHETTRLCLEAMEKHIDGEKSVLDLGCGSGILSVAALLLGAKRAVGVDIDALAVKTARENGAKNGFFPPKYTVFEGDLTDKVSGKFDVIVANIVADVIILLCKDVGAYLADGGVFIVSGIIDTRMDDVLEAFERFGFAVREEHCENGWMCFELGLKE